MAARKILINFDSSQEFDYFFISFFMSGREPLH